ncbi:unnamed protein product [Mytilus edulis]|uniref:C1q domain-containing protein n=1 Tax=Mytilus edulis TaxID=6550 RepID=A0A8S3QN33_MYTED|nr:unnamed protein product [Mytilus edulis]
MENLQQDNTLLRHDVDNSFVLLTNQIKQKLDLLDTKIAVIEKNNATNQDILKLEEKNKALEQRRESAVLRNKSILVDQEISNLKQLGSIQPLQEIKTLQQTVQTISAQTNSLSMKERARSQDFLALYNMTTDSLNNLEVRTQSKIKQLEIDHISSVRAIDHRVDNLINKTRLSQYSVGTQLSNIQSDFMMKLQETENLTLVHLHNIEKKSEDMENRNNLTFSRIQKQINDSTEQVAMTAHLPSTTSAAGILKFSDVKLSVGLNNLSAYKNTGKFVCETKGLYMISPSIMADQTGAQFYIYLNGKVISETYIVYNSNNPSTMRYTGTVVLVQQLLPNDSLWVYNPGYHLNGGIYTTFTIVKVK